MPYCTFLEPVHSLSCLYSCKFCLLHFFLPLLSLCVVQKVQVELDGLKKDLNKVSERTQEVLASPQPIASAPILRSELDLTVQKMDHTYMLSSIYLEK